MYTTCIFCHSNLGTNEVIEHFPVGRRLAFDAARGRLWVVCRKCERWNLTPLDERWEAIEECERAFRDTRLRVSTENIGLARIREGLELVRIGSPLRPEMAAWRYGDQFGRRRRKHLLWSGAGIATAAGLVILGPATGIIAGSSWGLWNIVNYANAAYQQRRVRARLVLPGHDDTVAIRLKQLNKVRVVDTDAGWGLSIPYAVDMTHPIPLPNGRIIQASRWNVGVERTAIIEGEAALVAASKLLPAINASGARKDEVQSAVGIIEQSPDPSKLFASYTNFSPDVRRVRFGSRESGQSLIYLPKEIRLALEMATHEDAERRALEGELSVLETAWKEAEEIAAIADDLFVPDETRARVAALKRDHDS